ncbi:MAG: hypothetical protein FWH05_06940 [Oscillospiraceae bacterium]|nr:hypothetical protein [Oscillospiraceae bacterium]
MEKNNKTSHLLRLLARANGQATLSQPNSSFSERVRVNSQKACDKPSRHTSKCREGRVSAPDELYDEPTGVSSDCENLPKRSRRREIIAKSKRLDENTFVCAVPDNPVLAGVSKNVPDNPKKIINISAILISDEIYEIMNRFNLCECEECLNAVYLEALAQMPLCFAPLREREKAQAELRPLAQRVLTKLCIAWRGRS